MNPRGPQVGTHTLEALLISDLLRARADG
jgi:hypothetical protein